MITVTCVGLKSRGSEIAHVEFETHKQTAKNDHITAP